MVKHSLVGRIEFIKEHEGDVFMHRSLCYLNLVYQILYPLQVVLYMSGTQTPKLAPKLQGSLKNCVFLTKNCHSMGPQ